MNDSLKRKHKLNKLLDRGNVLNDRIENSDANEVLHEVKSLIDRTDVISVESHEATQVKDPEKKKTNASENVIDVVVLKVNHDIVSGVATKLGNREFAENVHCAKITQMISERGQLNWAIFGKKILPLGTLPRFSQNVFGAFDVDSPMQKKVKKAPQQRKKAPVAELKRPEDVKVLKKEEKGAQILYLIKEQIENEYRRRNCTPLPYYELIYDPEDFMYTVDNAFQIAFLIRDNDLGLDLDEYEDPVVTIASKEEKESMHRVKQTCQAVFGLDVDMWLEMKRAYGEREPILKVNRGDASLPKSRKTVN